MNSIETATFVKKISFIFFAILGIGHFAFGGLYAKNHFVPASGIVTKILFIPFVIAGLAYVYGVIKEHLLFNGKYGKGMDYTFLTIGIICIIGLLILQFVFPDA